MQDTETLKITDSLGNVKEYKILYTFKKQSNNKNYIIYTDDTRDNLGNLNIYASIFYPDDNTKLEEIESEEDWNIVEKILTKDYKDEK